MKHIIAIIPKISRLFILLELLMMGSAYAQSALEAATTNATLHPPDGVAIAKASAPDIWLSFGLDRIPWLDSRTIAGIPLWQFLASFIYIFLAFYAAKLLDYFIRERVQKWTEKTETKIDDLLVNLVRGPVRVITFVILLHIGMRVYAWPEGMAVFLSNALKIIVACSITYVLLKAIDMLMGIWGERATTAAMRSSANNFCRSSTKHSKCLL